jgi:hypothetical protein
MTEASTFRTTLIFFDKLGIYDVILPFLLVFTIVFAILEKTRVLGTEKIDGSTTSKKNLNSLVAFVIAFLTIASSSIVGVINKTASHIVILLLLSVFFLLLIGSFMKETEEGVFLEGPWKIIFMIIMFVGIIFIFLNALPGREGQTWLDEIFKFLGNFNNSNVVSSIILIIVVVGFIAFIVKEPKKK